MKVNYNYQKLTGFDCKSTQGSNIEVSLGSNNRDVTINFVSDHDIQIRRFNRQDLIDFAEALLEVAENMEDVKNV